MAEPHKDPSAGSASLPAQLVGLTFTRTVFNTGYRMIYPFLPVIARGLGVDLPTVALALTARSSLGLASPLLGSQADQRGRKRTMLSSLLLFTASMGALALFPRLPVLFLALLGGTLAKLTFDPAMQAYLGDRVSYERRGLAIALTEFGWSLAFLVGVPLAGLAILRSGWSGPFSWLAVLGAVSAIVLWRILPGDGPLAAGSLSLAAGLRTVARHRSAMAGLAVGFCISLANEMVNVVFGAWLEQAFQLQILALGAASAVIGVAELTGEGLVAGLADKLGKRRAVAIGIGANVMAALALPMLGITIPGALLGLFLFYITFEITLVSAIPLMTELVPEARATVMAGNVGSHSAGRSLGALIALPLFAGGLWGNTLAAVGFDLLALFLLLRFVRE
jgi:predicted MFS family arabinose efflux permease